MAARGLVVRRALHGVIAALTVLELISPAHGGLHVAAGYALCALLALRLGLAFLGPRSLRVAAVLVGPEAPNPRPAAGHAWLGSSNGLVALALLLAVTAASVSGLAALAQVYGRGPLAPLIEQGPGKGIIIGVPRAFAAETSGDRPVLGYAGLHGLFAASVLGLGILHIGGLVLQSVAQRTNLFWRLIPSESPARLPRKPKL